MDDQSTDTGLRFYAATSNTDRFGQRYIILTLGEPASTTGLVEREKERALAAVPKVLILRNGQKQWH